MDRAARPLATLATALLIGCGGESSAPAPSTAVTVEAVPAAPARRPTRRFYLARTPERCEIFAEDGGERITEPFATPCPEYLLAGERIRIAGRTCMLDTNKAQPEREKPVVCPDPLTHFEKRERGEEK